MNARKKIGSFMAAVGMTAGMGAGPVSRQQHRFVAANSEIPGQGRTCADDQVRTTQSVGRHVAKSRSLCGTQR